MKNMILEIANDHSRDEPFLFHIGQMVKVRKFVLDDGQTHRKWIENKCEITNRTRTMISKTNFYRLKHPEGFIDEFKEEELDHRFVRKP